MNKNELRKIFLQKRKLIKDKENKSQLIAEILCNFEAFSKARTIGLYASLEDEVYTKYILEKCSDKRIAFPKVVGDDLSFYLINDYSDLNVDGAFGIKEPEVKENNLVEKDNLDLIVIPRCLL